jgi:hypothetical protein
MKLALYGKCYGAPFQKNVLFEVPSQVVWYLQKKPTDRNHLSDAFNNCFVRLVEPMMPVEISYNVSSLGPWSYHCLLSTIKVRPCHSMHVYLYHGPQVNGVA